LALLIAGIVLVSTFVALGALRAKGASAVAEWGLLLGVVALAVGAIGALVPLWDKLVSSLRRPEAAGQDPEITLAGVVLGQAQEARSRLLGAGEAGDKAANVQFVKGAGRYRPVGGADEGDLDTVLDYYLSLSPRRLVILGRPGAGKSVLAMQLLIRLLEQRNTDHTLPVPVLISAAAYDTKRPWGEWFTGHLAQRFAIAIPEAERLVRERRVLPMIDGLDEMDQSGKPVRARALVDALNSAAFMQGENRAAVVVTCRHKEYQALQTALDRATHIEMVTLDGNEIADYLAEQLRGSDEEAWEPVLAALRGDPVGPLAEQLATPWRMTLALTVFRDCGKPAEILPGPILDGYTERVNALLLDRYVSSVVRLQDPSGRPAEEQVNQLLTDLAHDLDWQAHHEGSATDIELDKWWRSVGPWAAPIIHIALLLPVAVLWLAIGIIDHRLSSLFLGSSLLIMAFAAGLPPTSPHQTKVGLLITRRGLRRSGLWFLIGLAGGLVAGLVAGFVAGSAAGLTVGIVVGLATGAVTGVATGLVFGIQYGLETNSPEAIGPRDLLRKDYQYGLIVGLMAGLVVGLVLGISAGLVDGVAFGFLYGLAGGVSFGVSYSLTIGAESWARYCIAVGIAAIRRSGPLRFGAALDWAYQAGLLRLAGVAFQFRHQQLQDWLMARSGDRAGEQAIPQSDHPQSETAAG
jgi:hypothetical protein